MNPSANASRIAVLLLLVACGLYGCNFEDNAGSTDPDQPNADAPSENAALARLTDDSGEPPWIILSNFTLESGGLNNTAQASYHFVQGGPDPGQTYYWFVEESAGGFASYSDEPVELEAGGGTLTMEVAGAIGRDQVYTFITAGPRSTSYSDPEPEHVSGDLYLGQSESAATPIAPGEEPPKPVFALTAVLSNPRHEQGDEGELIAIDYNIGQLPEAAGFWLDFVGAEGGSISYDVDDDIHAAPESGTLRRPVPDPEFLDTPYEVRLKCQPFGADTGSSGDTVTISEVISVE